MFVFDASFLVRIPCYDHQKCVMLSFSLERKYFAVETKLKSVPGKLSTSLFSHSLLKYLMSHDEPAVSNVLYIVSKANSVCVHIIQIVLEPVASLGWWG